MVMFYSTIFYWIDRRKNRDKRRQEQHKKLLDPFWPRREYEAESTYEGEYFPPNGGSGESELLKSQVVEPRIWVEEAAEVKPDAWDVITPKVYPKFPILEKLSRLTQEHIFTTICSRFNRFENLESYTCFDALFLVEC